MFATTVTILTTVTTVTILTTIAILPTVTMMTTPTFYTTTHNSALVIRIEEISRRIYTAGPRSVRIVAR